MQHKYKKQREQILIRLGRDNKQQYQLETARHHYKQQEYCDNFIMHHSRANDVIGSINKLYIEMKNKSVSLITR